jgi:Domain of unknown function (DUF5666)
MRSIPKPLTEGATLNTQRRLALHGAAATLLASAGLAGCGGSDATDPPKLPADTRRQPLGGVDSGGTGSPMAFFSAAITATAPLSAAGVSFDTSGCTITDADGQSLALHELAPGMTGRINATSLSLSGTTPSARALRVTVGEQLRGPVASVDMTTDSLTLLGQRVQLNSRTLLDLPGGAAGLQAGLQAGQRLRVWGELDTSGARIVATRVAMAPEALTSIVRGVLTRLDVAAGVVAIGAMLARFEPGDSSLIGHGVGTGAVVRAVLASGPGRADGSQVLLGLREDGVQLPDGVHAELEGRITRVDSPTRFAVDGVPVDAGTLATPPSAALLVPGARAAVRGLALAGLLRANSVTLEAPELVELEGSISAADAVARSFVVNGITVVWSASTRFEGGGAPLLKPRRRVAVVGHWNAERSQLLATRLHVEA